MASDHTAFSTRRVGGPVEPRGAASPLVVSLMPAVQICAGMAVASNWGIVVQPDRFPNARNGPAVLTPLGSQLHAIRDSKEPIDADRHPSVMLPAACGYVRHAHLGWGREPKITELYHWNLVLLHIASQPCQILSPVQVAV
jgi:hypothetical protein